MILTPEEVAERWRVSVRHVYRLVERRELPAMRFGRTVRLRLYDVEDFECRSISSSASVEAGPPPSMSPESASSVTSLRQRAREMRRESTRHTPPGSPAP